MGGAREVTLNRLRIALINFGIVAFLGCLLRYYFFRPFPGFIYPYTLHAHSHLAFLGWVFMALYALLLHTFLPDKLVRARKYTAFFLVLQVANIGMLFTFPFTGYALWSIIFSSVHAVVSMAFAVLFIRDAGRHLKPGMNVALGFIRWALILMFISNLGPFALGPVMAKGLGQSDLYYLIIYFYLHFQYNGWFTFALIGLLLVFLEKQGITTDTRLVRMAFMLKLVAIFPAYVLSTLWTEPPLVWHIIGGVAGLAQLGGLAALLIFILKNGGEVLKEISKPAAVLLFSGVLALSLGHLLQFLSAIPALGAVAFEQRNIVIAYLHLVLIGFVSTLLLFLILNEKFLRPAATTGVGLYVFLGGFMLSELVLFFQPYIRQSTLMLLGLAILQLLSLIIILSEVKRSTTHLPELF